MQLTRENIAAILPVFAAYASGKTVQHNGPCGWKDAVNPSFNCGPLDYRVKPEPDAIVAGEDLSLSQWVTVENGVATPNPCPSYSNSDFYVDEAASKGDRLRIVPKNSEEIRDKLVPIRTPEPEYKPYVPTIDGHLDLDWIRSQAKTFADQPTKIPMARDLGHCLIAVIDDLKAERDRKTEPTKPVSDGNWMRKGKAGEPIRRGAKAFMGKSVGSWFASLSEGRSPGYVYYDCTSEIEDEDDVEVNETTKQIRKAVVKPAVSDGNQDGFDPVNRAKHYNVHTSGIECIDIIEHFDFLIGSIVKYAWRAGLKDGATKRQDLAKCRWYADRAIEREDKCDTASQ